MIEQGSDGRYVVTALGRLAGEGALEVKSLVRVIGCLGPLQGQDITDPVLLATAQVTVELDAVVFPINKKSTQKEPQTWLGELERQKVLPTVLRSLHQHAVEQFTGMLRAKKAVACLYYVGGTEMNQIERAMTQFGGSPDGASGPIRSVASRTADVLPVIAHTGELLKPGLDLSSRASRLVVRLEYGVASEAVDLARFAGRELGRGDYRRLTAASLTNADAIEAATDEAVLEQLERDHGKLHLVREEYAEVAQMNKGSSALIPQLEPYEA